MSVLDGIENGLCDTKTCKKKRIKIRTRKRTQIDLKNIMIHINKIIKCLEISKINDFIFVICKILIRNVKRNRIKMTF